MLRDLNKLVALDNPMRLFYHKLRAIIANIIYGFPSKNMTIIGVTGTNGKTTTSNIVAKGLREAGKKVFMFSTVNIIINDKEYQNDTKMTSPDVFELQRLLKIAKKEGCEIAVIETASHGIKMNRIWGIQYDIVVLTNITQDHLDLHGTMKDYVNTKLTIFKNLISYKRKPGIKKTAIINYNSQYSDLFLGETYDSMYTYGTGTGVNLVASNITKVGLTTKFEVRIASDNIFIETKLKGDFNIQNLLAAIGVFISLGIEANTISNVIKKIEGVPGRMESIENQEGYEIIVDYAHTSDALEKVLDTIRGFPSVNRIITVFGATGDRDRTKRSTMGSIVSRLSDIVILTQDDDYSEKTEQIIKDVLPGIERKEGEDFWIIPTRKEAIQTALLMGEPNDVILVAGKGDEHVMVTNEGIIKWNDKEVIKELLKSIDDNKIV
ncbi:MAG: UDP-N-acetylmuramoyl-L-alanyl-D-glutamate--2,6-diaminopimelate ligase [Candidatus Gracilibacteria bacterium]|nr:UDP-N-acetylmuramoyl-L-alanyl-D-glutamate--2,6-diaminopimelate ligase [Candidatus Gracilibacteria bacterium]